MQKIFFCFLCLTLAVAAAPPPAGKASYHSNNPVREKEFIDWGVGMFIHWSLDSELGSVISHSMVGASEDYLDRYINELPKYFNPHAYDPESWVKLAKLAGFKYMVLTTKHHNGFCLWPTETTDFSVANTPYRADIVRQFVDACRKYDMKVGFYFSPEDFWFLHQQGHVIRRKAEYANISNNPELLAHGKAQIKELFTHYGPIDLAFLDAFDNSAIRDYIHELQPECIVTRGEMETPEQNIPDAPLKGPWEACFTLGSQWQFKPTNENYKSGTALIEMLIETRAKGGNLLLNVGPEPDGTIPFEQERIIRELGLWLFINQEAIYQVRPWHVTREDNLWFVRSATDPKTVYVFLTGITPEEWPYSTRKTFVLKSVRATAATTVSILGHGGKVVEYQPKTDPTPRFTQKDDGLHLDVMKAQRIYNQTRGPHSWPNPLVVKLTAVEHAAP